MLTPLLKRTSKRQHEARVRKKNKKLQDNFEEMERAKERERKSERAKERESKRAREKEREREKGKDKCMQVACGSGAS